MIKINAIITEKGFLKPETIPQTKYGSHCDGEYFYFFESKEDAKAFYDSMPVISQKHVKSDVMLFIEKATDDELIFLAKKLKDKLK